MLDRRKIHTIITSCLLASKSSAVTSADTAGGKYSRMRLRDGRYLSYREFGSQGGKPVLYFDATPQAAIKQASDDRNIASVDVAMEAK